MIKHLWNNYWTYVVAVGFTALVMLIMGASINSVNEQQRNLQQWADFRDSNYKACVDRGVPADDCFVKIYK